jgi:recombination protein RecA
MTKLSEQVEKSVNTYKDKKRATFDPPKGDFKKVVSTGSTLLDLAISGGVIRGGGIPGGVIVELFGPPSIGKTSMLCEIAGAVQRQGGQTQFYDPEARLSRTFAQMFGVELNEDEVLHPNTPTEVFEGIQKWKPKNSNKINGIFVDSSAALASDLEMENKKDEYSRRAKLFSQGLRVNARYVWSNNYLLVFSNQIRDKMDAGFGERTDTPGGHAIKFYASLRLKVTRQRTFKLKREIKYQNKIEEQVFGIGVDVEIYKSSIWKPYNTAPVYIDFSYGIDDIRANLEYVKKWTGNTVYYVGQIKLSNSMEEAIALVEEKELENTLKNQTIDIWEDIQAQFNVKRKQKKR